MGETARATLRCMRAQSPSGAGCYKALAPCKTQESLGRRDRAPKSSTPLVLGWRGLSAPFAHAPLLCAVTQGWRAGRPQLRAPGTCLCAGLTGRSSPSGMERSRWIFLHQVLCLVSCSAAGSPRCSRGTSHL